MAIAGAAGFGGRIRALGLDRRVQAIAGGAVGHPGGRSRGRRRSPEAGGTSRVTLSA